MKHLYFVRHGESEANVKGLVGGQFDSLLTKKGLNQGHSAGKLAKEQGLTFDVIITSPLIRARETAEAIAKELGYDPELIETEKLLIERGFGNLDGKFLEEEIGMTMEYYYANPLSVDHLEGVEKLADLHKRAEQIIEYAKKRPEDTVLLVSHNAVARSLRKVLESIPYDQPVDNFENAKIVKLI